MTLAVGSKAPDFTVNNQDGKAVSLSDLRGKKVVLYFYPKDMTPGCTFESCSLRDNYKGLLKAGYEVFGISTDNEKSHRKFIEKEKLPFSLLADTDKAVHEKYGTWIEKSMYGRKYMGTQRITFIIDENGVISEIINKVDTRNHAEQILGTTTSVLAKEVVVKEPSPKPAKKVVAKAAKPAKKVAKKKK